jgi:hypothetical protein
LEVFLRFRLVVSGSLSFIITGFNCSFFSHWSPQFSCFFIL